MQKDIELTNRRTPKNPYAKNKGNINIKTP